MMMAQSESGIVARIIRWFSGEELDVPVRRKKCGITEALAHVAQAEERLTTVEEATMSMTVADLPKAVRAKYEADNEEEDWF